MKKGVEIWTLESDLKDLGTIPTKIENSELKKKRWSIISENIGLVLKKCESQDVIVKLQKIEDHYKKKIQEIEDYYKSKDKDKSKSKEKPKDCKDELRIWHLASYCRQLVYSFEPMSKKEKEQLSKLVDRVNEYFSRYGKELDIQGIQKIEPAWYVSKEDVELKEHNNKSAEIKNKKKEKQI